MTSGQRMFEYAGYSMREREEQEMTAKKKTRLSVQFSNEVYDKINKISKSFGVGNSTLIQMIVGQHLDTYDKLLSAFTDPESLAKLVGSVKAGDSSNQ
jgi:hypothetical protein